ncbi:MAG: PH domain-containing protein [Pseudomonadota bacterium]
MSDERVFSASLGTRERLITYAVGYGVGMGVPLILGVSFAIGFSQPLILLFPVPFMVAFGLPYFFRPTGYAVGQEEIFVIRANSRNRIPLESVSAVVNPATDPPGNSVGIARVDGMYGTFGTFRNKAWGRYQIYTTTGLNRVEIRLKNGSRVILSPDDPEAFVAAISKVAANHGITIEGNSV